MSDFETAARPYAKALFELASEEGNLQAWGDSLQLATAVASDADMQAMFESPSMLVSEKKELFLSVMSGFDTGHYCLFRNPAAGSRRKN